VIEANADVHCPGWAVPTNPANGGTYSAAYSGTVKDFIDNACATATPNP